MSDSSKIPKPFSQIVAIRREEKTEWERRAPLAADHVRQLCQMGIKVIVQPSNSRIFSDDAYKEAGAEIKEDISEASVILGIKSVPQDFLLEDKTYIYYSHVNKGVKENMPTLTTCLSRNIRLMDYEVLCDKEGVKVPNIVFSVFAGMVGFINILCGLGLRLLSLGHNTPFLNVGMAHNYKGTPQAIQALREIGEEIALGKMPESIGPMVFAILGIGNSSKGVQKVFEELPHQYIEVGDLPRISKGGSMRKIYGVIVNTKDYLKKKDGGDFDREEYRNHSDRYESKLSKEVARYATVIINCLNWNHKCPVLMKNSEAKILQTPSYKSEDEDDTRGFKLPHKLLAICDVAAEHGAFEFITTYTSLDHPFFMYDAQEEKQHGDFTGAGVLVCSIDNMPSQLALEASESFANSLFPYVESIIASDATKPLDEQDFHPAVRGAVIASNGKLTPEFRYLQQFL